MEVVNEQVHDALQGFPAAPADAGGVDFPVLEGDQGLDVQPGSHHAGHFADAPAVPDIVQISHGEENAGAFPQRLQQFQRLIQGFPGVPQAADLQHIGALHQRGAQGVHHFHPDVRIVLRQHLLRNFGGLDGGAELGGDADAQDVLSPLCPDLELLIEILRRGTGRHGISPRVICHPLIKLLERNLQALLLIVLSVKGYQKMNDADVLFLHDLLREITGTVADNAESECHSGMPPWVCIPI